MIIPGVHPFGPVGPVWWAYAIRPYTGMIIRAHGPAPTNQQGRRPQHLNAPSGRMHVPGPPRVSPWAMIRRPYRAHGYLHQQTNGPHGPEWDVPGPPRVSPWAMIRRPYRAHGYPHQQTNRPHGPEWDVPGRAVGPGVCGRRRIWPGTRPIGANDRTGVGAYRIRPPNGPHGPEWMNARGRVFAPCRGARWGVFNTPLHGYPPKHLNA